MQYMRDDYIKPVLRNIKQLPDQNIKLLKKYFNLPTFCV